MLTKHATPSMAGAPAWRRLAAQARCWLGGLGFDARPASLLLVTGGGEWAVKEIAMALQQLLRPRHGDVQVLDHLHQRPFVTHAKIHCLCRPAFFAAEGLPALHRSNRLVVSWLHGGKRSREPQMLAACAQLERHWRTVRRFVVPNTTTQRDVLECGVDPAIVHVIPNGVDTTLFAPAQDGAARARVRRRLGIAPEAFVIGSFQRDGDDQGTPKLVKGPDTLVAALAALHARRPITALLTGSGRAYVRRELTRLQVPHVHTMLQQPRELASMYHAIDAYLISSREEGGPAALRESLASGVPVVSTRMGLPADLIQHGVNGLLAEVGDAQGLADGLLRLIEQPALAREIAVAGLVTIRPLDYAVIARRYEDEVYQWAFR